MWARVGEGTEKRGRTGKQRGGGESGCAGEGRRERPTQMAGEQQPKGTETAWPRERETAMKPGTEAGAGRSERRRSQKAKGDERCSGTETKAGTQKEQEGGRARGTTGRDSGGERCWDGSAVQGDSPGTSPGAASLTKCRSQRAESEEPGRPLGSPRSPGHSAHGDISAPAFSLPFRLVGSEEERARSTHATVKPGRLGWDAEAGPRK